MSFDVTDLIQAKSDQLNADDLAGVPRVIEITDVSKGNAESPIMISYKGDNGRPFKPCKTVRRILAAAYGNMTGEWLGKQLKLYCDNSVVYAGQEVGGIRIAAMSDIKKRLVLKLSKTRGKKVEHIIDILERQQKPPYPADKFKKAFSAMADKIANSEMTHEQVINKCELTGALSDEQKQQIRDIETEQVTHESVDKFLNGESE
jgi:hypothetical protein